MPNNVIKNYGFSRPIVRARFVLKGITPAIANKRADTLIDFEDAVLKGGTSAIAAGSIYHFHRTMPDMLKDAMIVAALSVRQSPTDAAKIYSSTISINS